MSTVWTLLITDDCQEDREIYREYLASDPDQSYQFIEAGSAEVGLALCQKQHCDAILLDFHLPDMTGLEFLDELKQQSNTPLPVIMLTGQGDERIAVQAMKRGVQDYLVKQDLEPDVLQLTVRNVIQQSHLQSQFNQQQEQQPSSAKVSPHFPQLLSAEASFLKDLTSQLAIALQQSEQLTQAREALVAEKQLNAVKSHLVATVSQEYRTLLATILAAASTLKLHGSKLHEAKQQQFLHLIENKARQMAQLVDNLLVIETFEAGKTNFAPLPFELLQFISNLIEEQRQSLSDRRELTFKITGNTKGFWGDQQLLRLILVNLLSNAIKYSLAGGTIEVHLTGNETHVVIEVKDEGIGIPPEEQPQLFQSFSRASNVGTIPGAGLGLAIVKACVDLHGGEVTLKSQAGKGTQFTVCLPKRAFT